MLHLGLAFAWGSVATLDLGSFRRMGPGAFPLLVGSLLAFLALLGLVQSLRAPEDTHKPDLFSVFGVFFGVAAFAFITPIFGVIPATAVAVLATSLAISEILWAFRILLTIGVAVGVWLIFVAGLDMPFDAIKWP